MEFIPGNIFTKMRTISPGHPARCFLKGNLCLQSCDLLFHLSFSLYYVLFLWLRQNVARLQLPIREYERKACRVLIGLDALQHWVIDNFFVTLNGSFSLMSLFWKCITRCTRAREFSSQNYARVQVNWIYYDRKTRKVWLSVCLSCTLSGGHFE